MKMLNLFGKSMVSVAVIAMCYGANAADNGRVGAISGKLPLRMPTMPTVGLTTIGNPAVTTVNQPVQVINPGGGIIPYPVNPDNPNNPDNPDNPDNPQPQPSDCPDGGVRNSDYTVSMCMDDILGCVNTGALQGGLNDLFNEDVRNSIMGGMQLCQNQVDRCIREVRIDCRNVYNMFTDVWLDFNSRVIQPEYYNFVLRRTGLTPNQAENTCLLLDRNTYGSSFAAVSDQNAVNTEYNNKVGAYNRQENASLSKNNPQGEKVNDTGYDGNRGHYARWDASKAECLIRVAAYNKDNLITNSWLFGAVGDNNPAEVWEKAGSSFTCNKELFDFNSLLNTTKTVAVVGVGGGTLVGAAIGAGAGAAAYNKKKSAADEAAQDAEDSMYKSPCEDDNYRKKLGYQIRDVSHKDWVLETYLFESVKVEGDGKDAKITGTPIFDENTNYHALSKDQCEHIHDLYSKINLYNEAVNYCDGHLSEVHDKIKVPKFVIYEKFTVQTNGNTITCGGGITCDNDVIEQDVINYKNNCLFLPLQVAFAVKDAERNILCNHAGTCVSVDEVKSEISQVRALLNEIAPVVDKKVLAKAEKQKELSKGKEIGKGVAIGAATGAAAGGLATAITAFVERSNITCKVGDGLDSVSLGKSYSIDSLKDFYVKWNLKLPDTVSPTSAVNDMASWEQACKQFNSKLMDCPKVQINLKVDNRYELVPTACKISGSVCVVNYSVASSHGIE